MATKSMFELSDDENESEVDKTAEKESKNKKRNWSILLFFISLLPY